MLQLGKDFEEAVKNKATTVLLYFANTLIEKKPLENRKAK